VPLDGRERFARRFSLTWTVFMHFTVYVLKGLVRVMTHAHRRRRLSGGSRSDSTGSWLASPLGGSMAGRSRFQSAPVPVPPHRSGRPSMTALYLAAASKKSLVSRATDRVLGSSCTRARWRDDARSVPALFRSRSRDVRLCSTRKRSASHRSVSSSSRACSSDGDVRAFAFGLRKFGGMEYTGRVIGLELSRASSTPTLTAVIVRRPHGRGHGSRSRGDDGDGANSDAIRALRADPFKKLVLPRLVASIIVMPILAGFALTVGFSGRCWWTDLQFGIPAPFFLNSALEAVSMADFVERDVQDSLLRAIIALVGCHFGLQDPGGHGGGRRRPRHATVVVISITILIADSS